jgi:hypothetical protein
LQKLEMRHLLWISKILLFRIFRMSEEAINYGEKIG